MASVINNLQVLLWAPRMVVKCDYPDVAMHFIDEALHKFITTTR